MPFLTSAFTNECTLASPLVEGYRIQTIGTRGGAAALQWGPHIWTVPCAIVTSLPSVSRLGRSLIAGDPWEGRSEFGSIFFRFTGNPDCLASWAVIRRVPYVGLLPAISMIFVSIR